jgi:hypothetical protein
MDFTFKIYLPTLERYSRYRQITNDMYMTLVKYIQNSDDEYILKCFDEITHTNVIDQTDPVKLSKVDMFCVLLNLRILCVSDQMDILYTVGEGEDQVDQKIKLNLYDVLDKVTNYNIVYNKVYTISDECKLKLRPPTNIMLKDDKDVFNSVVDTLYLFDKQYDISGMTSDQLEIILDSLPTKILTTIVNYIKKIDSRYRIEVFDIQTAMAAAGKTSQAPEKYQLKMFDNSFFEFLKLCYSDNLQNLYYTRYVLVKHLGYTMESLKDLTPQDLTTYISMYKKELEDERKAMEKSSSPQGSISLPTPNLVD